MIRSVEHFSFTVSNMEESLHFFCDLLGFQATPIMEVDDPQVCTIVGMPGARLRISLVSLPQNMKIELIQYLAPEGRPQDLATSNPGVAHIAFEVTGLDQMYQDLSVDELVRFVNPPVWAPGNDGKGTWGVCYLKGPDQITFELIEKKI